MSRQPQQTIQTATEPEATKLAVVLPSRGLMFSETFEELLRELEGFEYEIFWAHGKSLPECFNEPTERALKDPSVYAVLFCEDDMIIPNGILKKMFAQNYPVVALDYPFQIDGDSTCLHDPKGMAFWTGTGFMLVARQILENLEKPIWRTDRTFDPFIDSDTIHFWPRKLNKVFYGLHDLNFGMVLYSSGVPVMPMTETAGQRKLVELGTKHSNNGSHSIEEVKLKERKWEELTETQKKILQNTSGQSGKKSRRKRGTVNYAKNMLAKEAKFITRNMKEQQSMTWSLPVETANKGEKISILDNHQIKELTKVGANLVSGMIDPENANLFLGALNRVKNVKFWEDIPPFISYDEHEQPYLNDGREFSRVQ